MQKVYCRQNIVDFLLLEEESTIYKIIEAFCDVVTDLDTEEILELRKENPVINKFMKRDSGTFLGDCKAFENISFNKYDNFLNDILILPDEIDVEEVRRKYGILALHLEDKFPDEQNYHFGFTINGEQNNPFKDWESVFSRKSILPVNSAILIDNFLWEDLRYFGEDNGENLYPIIENIISKDLCIPFKLSIVIQNTDGRFTPEIVSEKIKKIEKNLKKRTGVKVEVGVVTQTDTKIFHERVMITNYHYIYSDKGFTVFKKGRVRKVTKGDRNWVFLNIGSYYGEIRKHHHGEVIKNIKTAIEYNKRIKSGNPSVFNTGQFENPLLN